jgi:hypothetical protein
MGYGAPDLVMPSDSYNPDMGFEVIDQYLLNEAATSNGGSGGPPFS